MATDTSFLSDLNKDGFAVIREFLSSSEITELHTQMDRYLCDVVPNMPPEHVFYEDRSDPTSLKQMQDLGTYDSWFGELFLNGRPRRIAEQSLSSDVVPRNLQYFSKPPSRESASGSGRPTPAHQDGCDSALLPYSYLDTHLPIRQIYALLD